MGYVNNFSKIIAQLGVTAIFAPRKMSDGVTGNTSDFGSEESRFET